MMGQQSSESTTQSTIVYDSDGSVVMKQEPQNHFSQLDVMNDCGLNENVLNIEPIVDNKTKICKIENVYSIKQEPHDKWCELYGTFHHPTVKRENELDVYDCNQDSKLFKRDITLKMESFQTADTSSQSIEESGAIDCKDGIINNFTGSILVCGDSANQTNEGQSDAAQQQPPCQLEGTDEIKTKGM